MVSASSGPGITDSTSFFADSGDPSAAAQAVSDDTPGTTSMA